jgi:hypothetical protein
VTKKNDPIHIIDLFLQLVMSAVAPGACAQCGLVPARGARAFKVCPCRTNTSYCSKACQTKHRRTHKEVCVVLRDATLDDDSVVDAVFDLMDRLKSSGLTVNMMTAAQVDRIQANAGAGSVQASADACIAQAASSAHK